MARPKLQVNHVWVLTRIVPYDGSETIGVFSDDAAPRQDRRGGGMWVKHSDGTWSTLRATDSFQPFHHLEKFQIRTS